MELCYGILSTSSIAPRFIAAVPACGKGRIVAVSSRTLEKGLLNSPVIAEELSLAGIRAIEQVKANW